MRSRINKQWYSCQLNLWGYLLLPLSWLFTQIVRLRCQAYKLGILRTHHFNQPVIVVGNVTVGGTGKTPFVIWLAHFLSTLGYKPGIVSRGVGGKGLRKAHRVNEEDEAKAVGDEALLLRKRARCPVVVGKNRVAAVKKLLDETDCNIVISDDGLQHYALGRHVEIAMMDGMRQMGNKKLLPAGPLREPLSRLKTVDLVIVNGGDVNHPHTMFLQQEALIHVCDEKKYPLAHLLKQEVHALAAIGNPERFFLSLRNAGYQLKSCRVFADHYLFKEKDFDFADDLPIIMTEKDAIKCKAFADSRFWYVRVNAKMNEGFEHSLLQLLEERDEHPKSLFRANP